MRLTSKDERAFTRFVPMAPAPPVTKTVLRRKVSMGSSMSIGHVVFLPHPFYRPPDALFRSNLRIVLKVANRFGAVHGFILGSKRLRVFVGDQGIVPTY